MLKKLFTTILVASIALWADEYHHITHTVGEEIVNGISVSVTKVGGAVENSSYCEEITSPYFVGYEWVGHKSVSGSYTFTFTPPVKKVKLNFSGVTNTAANQEIVSLYVNDEHFAIPFAGFDNECDAMAQLTEEGNITGGEGLNLSGWQGTILNGPITSLTVKDSVVRGMPSGALFSLYITDPATSVIFEDISMDETFNPSVEKGRLSMDMGSDEYTGEIVSLKGQVLPIAIDRKKLQQGVVLDNLAKGVYFLRIRKKRVLFTRKFLVR